MKDEMNRPIGSSYTHTDATDEAHVIGTQGAKKDFERGVLEDVFPQAGNTPEEIAYAEGYAQAAERLTQEAK